jgi:hypothetical protein
MPDESSTAGRGERRVRRFLPRFRVWHLMLLIAGIGVCLAIYGTDRSQFDMHNYGNVDLPGGGRGDMFLFRAKDLRRPIAIVHYVDGKQAATIATLGVEREEWVIITIPDGSHSIRVFDFPSETVHDLSPPSREFSMGGMMTSSARPTSEPSAESLFLKRELTYHSTDGGVVTRKHAFHLLFR